MLRVFASHELLPAEWRSLYEPAVTRTFNPGLLRDDAGWLLAYRVVGEPDQKRRIALCRLTDDFAVVPGSAVPFSDWIRFEQPELYPPQATTWFADPRLYRLQGRWFIYWNSGWHEPRNAQFLQEFDPVSLRPVGSPREMTLWGARQKLEKNWALFEHNGEVLAVYSVNPHRVLTASLAGGGPIEFADVGQPLAHSGGYAKANGGLRGGSPPVRQEESYVSFCHSIENDPQGYRYVAAVYRFAAGVPFQPLELPTQPLAIVVPEEARRKLPKLNPAVGEVVYVSGAAFHGEQWVISFGVDDERCAIATLSDAELRATLRSER